MFDIGGGELVLIGVVALVVIGPKELPGVLRTVGQTVTKLRRMAGEFQSQFQEALREADMEDVGKTVTDLHKGFNPIQTIRDELKGAVEGPVGSPALAATETGVASASGITEASEPAPTILPAPPLPEVTDAPPAVPGIDAASIKAALAAGRSAPKADPAHAPAQGHAESEG
jgi:sec-independent protein translocase protein TatB